MATQLDLTAAPPLLAQLLRLGPSASQLGLLFALAAALTLAAGVVLWAMRPSFVPLYASMGERDAGNIIAGLSMAVRHALPVSFVTNGPGIPADIRLADVAKLVARARELAQLAHAEHAAAPAEAGAEGAR